MRSMFGSLWGVRLLMIATAPCASLRECASRFDRASSMRAAASAVSATLTRGITTRSERQR